MYSSVGRVTLSERPSEPLSKPRGRVNPNQNHRELLRRVVNEVVGDYARRSKDAWKNIVRKYRIEDARIGPMITITADENWLQYRLR